MRTRRLGPWLALVVLVHVAAAAAGFVAPHDPETQHRDYPFAPPSRLRLIDADGRWRLRPFAYPWKPAVDPSAAYQEDRSQPVPLRLFVAGPAYRIGGLGFSTRLIGVEPAAPVFLLGTDAVGRDQLSRLLHGARVSLTTGLAATLLTLAIGLAAGAAAGFLGGWTDRGLMFVADLLLVLPWTYLLLAVRSVLPLTIEPAHVLTLLALVLGLVGWARPGRLVRAVVRGARAEDFVTASRAMGARPFHVLRRHVLPATAAVVLTQAALLVPRFVLAEVGLSFLGLGAGEPAPSWGSMLAAAQQYDVLAAHWWMLAPGLALVPVCYSYHALADALHQRLRVQK